MRTGRPTLALSCCFPLAAGLAFAVSESRASSEVEYDDGARPPALLDVIFTASPRLGDHGICIRNRKRRT
jgi:hypothetical protein